MLRVRHLGSRLAGAAILSQLAALDALAQTNPQGAGPLNGAVNWVKDIMLGPIAISIGVVAVAVVGFMMLTGRMNWKHGITVLVGLFIIFGAPAIVAGIQATAATGR